MFDSVPDILSQLIRTAFVAREGSRFIVADFSAIEARVIAWLAGEEWRMKAFAEGKDIYCASASAMFGVPVVKHGINGELRQKGKVAELACGYGGSVGALKAFGADKMGLTETEMQSIVDNWRASSPRIVQLWWNVDRAIKQTLEDGTTHRTHGLMFSLQKGILFIRLPSGRRLAYVKPRLIDGKITYEGVSSNKGWARLESYGPKFVENITQAISRDLLLNAMKQVGPDARICMHIHDELVIEADSSVKLDDICQKMAQVPEWAEGLLLRADGYETKFYLKD